ncbi:c-type cytochrome [Microbaculum sp. FT89]|uniref:c-type cytochrome n=1 Tax=Microbaculum sp. FT89 TaxID=3447298 RepID=UPI003F52984A
MTRRIILSFLALALIGAGAFWLLTTPRTLAAGDLPDHRPDVEHGRYMFFAGGCASCHATPGQEDPLVLGGGLELPSPFGTFHVPNISPDADTGIGGWSTVDFANAMVNGVSPDGSHYYPAFPYTSYQRMKLEDVIDLKAFLDTLAPASTAIPGHDLPFPFNIRRALGVWKLLNFDGEPFAPDPAASEEINRGAYLVTGPGHCGECHTPRDALGGLERDKWLSGAPSPDGKGKVPDITATGLKDWSANDIAYALETGFTPEFDTLGSSMAAVVRNMAELTPEDRAAIAAYLKSVPGQ